MAYYHYELVGSGSVFAQADVESTGARVIRRVIRPLALVLIACNALFLAYSAVYLYGIRSNGRRYGVGRVSMSEGMSVRI